MPSTQPNTPDKFDDVVREYIDFINSQVGMYMDSLAGFAGHSSKVERQVHRANRPTAIRKSDSGEPVMVWASYEDPSKPDIVHNRIIRADEYLSINAPGGANEQQQARSILVFLFTFWELEIRPRLAMASGLDPNEIPSDIMGDLREVRHSILHAKGILSHDKHKKLKKLGSMLLSGKPMKISYDDMHNIFVLIKQDCARLMMEWLKVNDPSGIASSFKDIAIQRLEPPAL